MLGRVGDAGVDSGLLSFSLLLTFRLSFTCSRRQMEPFQRPSPLIITLSTYAGSVNTGLVKCLGLQFMLHSLMTLKDVSVWFSLAHCSAVAPPEVQTGGPDRGSVVPPEVHTGGLWCPPVLRPLYQQPLTANGRAFIRGSVCNRSLSGPQ